MDSLHLARRSRLREDENAWRVQRALVTFLEDDWRNPDERIWEVRGPKRHFTQSKVMAWGTMDRAVKAVRQFGLDGNAEKWRRARDEIHAQVCREESDPELNSLSRRMVGNFPQAFSHVGLVNTARNLTQVGGPAEDRPNQ